MQIVICISKQMLVSVSAVTAAISTENCSSLKFGEELWTENQRIWNQQVKAGPVISGKTDFNGIRNTTLLKP